MSFRDPPFPKPFVEVLHPLWLGRARRELDYAAFWASSENPISYAGALAKAVLRAARAQLAHRGLWALNEKRMVQWANLDSLFQRFSHPSSSRQHPETAINEVRSAVAGVEADIASNAH